MLDHFHVNIALVMLVNSCSMPVMLCIIVFQCSVLYKFQHRLSA
jgi:hypothetical protein